MTATTRHKRGSRTLLLIGVVFHIVYAASIFDIYFRSPIVHGMQPIVPGDAAPAKRLVLFVGDGLRADRLYEPSESGETRAPYLRHIIETQGAWGVSHTRVPTESRPGHVAIIAGLYEDVSAVTKGWQENPVEFDSVFNSSVHTWSFGSPDILPMFSKGASGSRVETFMYEAHTEDFSKDAKHMDEWVFDRVQQLFQEARDNLTLASMMRQDKVVFFLHLLGLDTNGHAHRPHSQEYLNNIAYVDSGVKRIVQLFEDYFGPDGTAYVFTADHGMNDRGAHGDGDPANTRTPIVAWGAGIRGPRFIEPDTADEETIKWGLGHVARVDIEQAAIASLMSAVIGLPFPMNSVGVLPLDYLDTDSRFKATVFALNARQIYSQYIQKAKNKNETELIFFPFKPLDDEKSSQLLQAIEDKMSKNDFDDSITLSRTLIDLSLRGLHYYQTYDWLFLRSVVSAGYFGWIAFSVTFMVKTYSLWSGGETLTAAKNEDNIQPRHNFALQGMMIFWVVLSVYLYLTSAPLLYHAYTFFPCFFWGSVINNRAVWWPPAQQLINHPAHRRTTIFGMAAYIAALEVLVYSYFQREILGVIFLGFAIWPLFMPAEMRSSRPLLITVWVLSCIACGNFMRLPVVAEEQVHLVIAGGIALAVMGLVLEAMSSADSTSSIRRRDVLLVQLLLIAASVWLVNDTTKKLNEKQGLPLFNQILTWIVFLTSLIVPFTRAASRPKIPFIDRLNIILLGFGCPLVILSISYEVLFYVSLSTMLLSWLYIERKLFALSDWDPLMESEGSTLFRKLKVKDGRLAFFFLFFINVAYFGTGNVASIASFSTSSVYRLTTVFDPFLMGGLLLFKIMLPFFFLAAIFGMMARSIGLPPSSLFVLVLSVTDVMTLNFFFLVRDQGSWLEIGTSISHFIIASGFIVFLTGVFYLSHLLVGSAVVRKPASLQNKSKHT